MGQSAQARDWLAGQLFGAVAAAEDDGAAMSYRISLSTATGRQRAHALIDRAPDTWIAEVREATRSDAVFSIDVCCQSA
jgi:hypothetical protein